MEEGVHIKIDIFPKRKHVCFAEENLSEVKYKFENVEDIAKRLQHYLQTYCKGYIESEKRDIKNEQCS